MMDSSKEFLDECSEAHAFGVGVVKGFLESKVWRIPKKLKKDVREEYHYYMAGYLTGNIGKLVVVGCIVKILV